MDFNSVPEASTKVKLSIALIAFIVFGSIVLTIYIMRYKLEMEHKLEELEKKPDTEIVDDTGWGDNDQIAHIDKSVHELELEHVLLKSRITKVEAEVKWLRENCRCK